jgi:hypothetical protein
MGARPRRVSGMGWLWAVLVLGTESGTSTVHTVFFFQGFRFSDLKFAENGVNF